MIRFRSALLSIALAAFLLVFPSCSKDQRSEQKAGGGARAGEGLLGSELLSKIPVGSLGFFIWDTSTGAYRKFKDSPWGEQGLDSVLQTLNTQPDSDAKEAVGSILGIITDSGLVASGKGQTEEPVSQGVGFVEYTGQSPLPSVGLYLSGRQGVKMQEKLTSLAQAFEKEGFGVEKKDGVGGEGTKGLVIRVPQEMKGDLPVEALYVAANDSHLAMATSEAHVKRPFGKVEENGYDKLKASPEFAKTTSKLGSSAGQIAMAYFDINQVVAALQKAMGDSPEAAEIKEIPVGAIALAHGMDETPSGVMTATLSPKNEEQKAMLSNLTAKGGNELVSKSPASLLVYLGLDGNILVNAKNAALTQVAPEDVEPYKGLIDSIDAIKGMAIGLKGASAGSPFPEVLLMIQSPNAAELGKQLRGEIEGAVSGAGMPLAAWQEKDVNGAKVSFALTPLGVGLFFATVDDKLGIASSEPAIADFVTAAKGGPSLFAKLSSNTKELLTDPAPLFSIYTDFEGLAGMMESMQGTLAMFTGGQSGLESESVEQWRKMGSVAVAMDHDAGVLRLRSGYEKPVGKSH